MVVRARSRELDQRPVGSQRARLRDEHAGLDASVAEISLLEHDKAELERQLASFREEQQRLRVQLSAARATLEKDAGQE